jgi:replicative superfamily II helicase
MCLASAFRGEPGMVCFLAPYISLGNQVAKSFRQHFPKEFRVHMLIGGYKTTEQLHPEEYKEVIVATPERFDSLLCRRSSENVQILIR